MLLIFERNLWQKYCQINVILFAFSTTNTFFLLLITDFSLIYIKGPLAELHFPTIHEVLLFSFAINSSCQEVVNSLLKDLCKFILLFPSPLLLWQKIKTTKDVSQVWTLAEALHCVLGHSLGPGFLVGKTVKKNSVSEGSREGDSCSARFDCQIFLFARSC